MALYDQLYPPKNGGALRCFNLAHQLSIHFDTDILCLQPGIEFIVRHHDGVDRFATMTFITPNLTTTKEQYIGFNKIKIGLKYRLYYNTLSSTGLHMVDLIPLWRKLKDKKYDIVIFEHLESLSLYETIKKLFPRALIIFDAHNIDHQLLENERRPSQLIDIKRQESTLFRHCDLVFSCSQRDANEFSLLNQHKVPVHVVPNGVDTHTNLFTVNAIKPGQLNLIFCGSMGYEPNYKGLSWFLKNVWPQLIDRIPFAKLIVVGQGKPDDELLQLMSGDSNVEFKGEVADVKVYYRNAHIAIVPLLKGSGTRLKILEAMSLGVPVISTSIGAEGIDYKDLHNIIIADSERCFLERLIDYYNNPCNYTHISSQARYLVESKYSWDIIGGNVAEIIQSFSKKEATRFKI